MFQKLVIILLLLAALAPVAALAAEEPVIDFFHSRTCPVCAREQIFLDQLQEQYPDLTINRREISEPGTTELIFDYYRRYQVPEDAWGLVPATFIGPRAYLGFSDQTAVAIESQIAGLVTNEEDPVITSGTFEAEVMDQLAELKKREIKIPFLGRFSVAALSPLSLSVTVGVLDGFNACAMVALSILLAILVASGARKRLLLIGGTFILVSGAVYYIFIAAWLNVFLFLGYIRLVTYIVAGVVILFAVFLLRDYFNGIICKFCDLPVNKPEGRLARFQKYLFARANRAVSSEAPLLLVLLGIAVIAAGINLVELFCSLGFPLAYTKLLASHNLPAWQYYWYLLVYIIFYMIDDFLIFLAAVITLRVTRVSERYFKLVKIISGLVLLILGVIMLLRPETLTF